MNERQRRRDDTTANAVARALNILEVRSLLLAERYMAHKQVPASVIERVLRQPALRRKPSSSQLQSEAITPSQGSKLITASS